MMEFKVEIKYNQHTLGVEGTWEPLIPAVPPSLTDPGSPADGGQYEVTDIYVLRYKKGRGESSRRLSPAMLDSVCNKDEFHDKMQDALFNNRRD
jgi:hypothetical protein